MFWVFQLVHRVFRNRNEFFEWNLKILVDFYTFTWILSVLLFSFNDFYYEMSVKCHDQNSGLSKNHKENFMIQLKVYNTRLRAVNDSLMLMFWVFQHVHRVFRNKNEIFEWYLKVFVDLYTFTWILCVLLFSFNIHFQYLVLILIKFLMFTFLKLCFGWIHFSDSLLSFSQISGR